MPSGLRKTSGNGFEIYYEQPWGGVASDKDPVDIAENQLVKQQGVVNVDGVLSYLNFPGDPNRWGFSILGTDPVARPFLIFELAAHLYAVDQFGNVYVYFNSPTPLILQSKFEKVAAFPADGPWIHPPSAVVVINGLAYISNYGNHSIYTFDGLAMTLANDYTGGLYLGVLDDYLLQFNTNQVVDGEQPTRVNWSGPGEFSTWDPSIDRTSGFNDIAAVDDEFSGFLSYASVGVAITRKGLIELSPTGVAIGPFNFTALWTSEVGQGCTYPDTITQYGQLGFLLTDSSVYSVSTGAGFTDIASPARKAIFDSFQTSNYYISVEPDYPLVAGCVSLYPYNSTYAVPFYMLVFAPISASANILVFWLLNIKTGTWENLVLNVDKIVNAQFNNSVSGGIIQYLKIGTYDTIPGTGFFPFVNPLTLLNVHVSYGGVVYPVLVTPYLYARDTDDSTVNTAGELHLQFRTEEIKLGHTRKPTIRRVVVKAYGTGDLIMQVNGIAEDGTLQSQYFGVINLDGTTNARTYYTKIGICTLECPYLTIDSTNFKGVIVKAMMVGTFADGDID